MIYGIGVDIVKIERMASSLEKFGHRFAERILHKSELVEYDQTQQSANFLAKRFAAKEAMAKALGTGFQNGLSLKHIQISHAATGRPEISCNETANRLLEENNITTVHLSISDEQDNAVAFVVLESE